MRVFLSLFLAALGCAGAALADDPPTVDVMIVGGFHMANPGRDLHNLHAPDMLSPKNQADIEAVTQALARFHPTLVAAEDDAKSVAEHYPRYLDGSLPTSRNEVVQLGFRLAKASNARMQGIDLEGDFPFEAVQTFAAAHGQSKLIEEQGSAVQAMVDQQARVLDTQGVIAELRFLNEPERLKSDNSFYRSMLRVGEGADQPGALLDAAWYRRNLLICANLIQATKPGDRVVVFYGSGHAFLLRQCVTETPGFRLVEPNDYLPR